MERIFGRLHSGDITAVEAEQQWMEQRQDDPDLSEAGVASSEDFARHYVPLLQTSQTSCICFVSPFVRTCKTIQPFQRQCQEFSVPCDIVCHPDVFEVGGVYTMSKDGSKKRSGPGECCTARQLQELFGEQYDVSQLPKEGGWYQSDFEPDLEAWQRTKRVGAWLRSVGLQEQVGDRLVILVVHGAFINLLLHELLGVELRPGPLNEAGASFGFPMPNTGTSLLELPAGRYPPCCA